MAHQRRIAQENGEETTEGGDDAAAAEGGEAAAAAKPIGYWEMFTYGLIDGTTADFNGACRDAMKTTVNGAFRVYAYKGAYKGTPCRQMRCQPPKEASISRETRPAPGD